MRYGLPYKGSKNGIAKWIVQELPPADVFCDLFFGGGCRNTQGDAVREVQAIHYKRH